MPTPLSPPGRTSARPQDFVEKASLKDVVICCEPKSKQAASPELKVSLASARFAATMILSLLVFIGILVAFLRTIDIDTNVHDALGSTERVDYWIGIYQVVNGFVNALIGMVVDAYFTIFIVVSMTFLRNVRWFPGDDPSTLTEHQPQRLSFRLVSARIKKLVLWGFAPAIMYNLKVGITAMFISHQTTGFQRNFLPADLSVSGASFVNATSPSTTEHLMSMGNGVSVIDTILRGAVRQGIVPLAIDPESPCMQSNPISLPQLPTVKQLRSVSAVFGFPAREWIANAVPFGLNPTHSFNVQLMKGKDIPNDRELSFAAFQLQSSVSWLTMYELLLQGKLLFERSLSDSNARNGGAVSSLSDLAYMNDDSMHTVYTFMETVRKGFTATTSLLEADSTNMTIEVYDITPHIALTSITLDIPYDRMLRYSRSASCDGINLRDDAILQYSAEGLTDAEIETKRQEICDSDQYVYDDPRAACGQFNCIFVDQTEMTPFKKGLQMMPYTVNCSTKELDFDTNFRNFFPRGCEQVSDAVFLYGLGSYITGEMFDSGYDSGKPQISKPQRHLVFTFAKLEWTFEDLSAKFDATCGISQTNDSHTACDGLVYDLEVDGTGITVDPDGGIYKRVLVLGRDQLPSNRLNASYRSPLPLLSFTTRLFFYPQKGKFFEWDYLDHKLFKETNWPETKQKQGGLNGTLCSALVDSYISMLETNHLYMGDTRQPLYTAALFYLFQDAAVKTVKIKTEQTHKRVYFHDLNVSGWTALKGDRVNHEIRFKIPLLSLILTFVGLGFFVLLVIVTIVCPTPRLRMVEDPAESVAHKYVRFRQDGDEAKDVLDCGLTLPSGKRVDLDAYVVDSLTLHHKSNKGKKIYL